MSDLPETIRGLNDLGKAANYSAQGFQGFKKSLFEAASGASEASKRWTIFSRLVSGTPIWKIQNYIRGALGVLAEFDQSARNQAEALRQSNEAILANLQNYDSLKKAVSDANEVMKGRGDATMKKELDTQLQQSLAYQKVLIATGNEEMARLTGVKEYNRLFKEETKMRKKIEEQIKFAHAYDKDRVNTAKQLAKNEAQASGLSRRQTRKKVRKAGKEERRLARREQSAAEGKALKNF